MSLELTIGDEVEVVATVGPKVGTIVSIGYRNDTFVVLMDDTQEQIEVSTMACRPFYEKKQEILF